MVLKPFPYHLELFEQSYINDPSLSIFSSPPVPSFTIGDIIDHRAGGKWSKQRRGLTRR